VAKKRPVGKPPHKPTADQRKSVQAMTGFGIKQEDICTVIGICLHTLHKYYREEIDTGVTKANAMVAEGLFKQSMAGNVSAQIFWLKTRARWKEPPQEHTGEDGGPIGFAVEYVKAKKNA